jgi:DNA-binding IclR family transcriptional regulator
MYADTESRPEMDAPIGGAAPKIVALIEAVAFHPDGVSVREISRDTGLDKSTVSRVFNQLAALDIVTQAADTGRFFVGPRLQSLGEALHTHHTLWGLAEPIVRNLSVKFNETCYLVLRNGYLATFQDRVESQDTIRYVIEPGRTVPLYAGAAGRSILSGMTDAEVDAYLAASDLVPITEYTMTDVDTLKQRVREDRIRGFSTSDGETFSGGHGIGSPVFRADGECVAAILITTPNSRYNPDRVPAMGVAAREAGLALSKKLGFGHTLNTSPDQ